MTALLGSATVVDARTGRKLNNALTLTFKTSPEEIMDPADEFVRTAVFWDKAAPLKAPTLGARLDLDRPVGSAPSATSC